MKKDECQRRWRMVERSRKMDEGKGGRRRTEEGCWRRVTKNDLRKGEEYRREGRGREEGMEVNGCLARSGTCNSEIQCLFPEGE